MSDEERENEDLPYGIESESSAEMTLEGKYKCRMCGKIFDTLEAHDVHYRKVHSKLEFQPVIGMAL